MSAHARSEDRRRALDAGFDIYLPKPVLADQLIAAVDDLRQLFLVPGNSREGAPKPVPPGGLGANESPILD